jgi:hypothetical protein
MTALVCARPYGKSLRDITDTTIHPSLPARSPSLPARSPARSLVGPHDPEQLSDGATATDTRGVNGDG